MSPDREPVDGRRALGAEGEARAADWLRRRGYRILDRNPRAGGVELDLVVQRGAVVVFVEVKARRVRRFGGAVAAVDARKQRRLVQGAAAWLRSHAPRARRVRFDVVTYERDARGDWRLRHIEAAFDAG